MNTITIPRAWLEGLKGRVEELSMGNLLTVESAQVQGILGYLESAELFSSTEEI